MKHIILILLTLSIAQAKRCRLTPKTNSSEVRIVFPNMALHTDQFRTCELLLKVHNYRKRYGVLSVLTDYKMKASYMLEAVKL